MNSRSGTEFSALKEIKFWMDSHVDSAGMKCATGTISPSGIIGIKNENESGFFFEKEKKEKKNKSDFLEETFAMIKPIAASNYGDEIISVILGHGFEIVQQLSTTLTLQKAEQFYAEHSLKGYFKYLTEYISSGPIVALHLRRVAAVAGWKHLIGYVCPALPVRTAQFQNVHFIISDFSTMVGDSRRQLIHVEKKLLAFIYELNIRLSIFLFDFQN